MSTAIVWFRRDLRLADHAALAAACAGHAHVLPVYIHAPQEEAPWAPGAASQWWLHQSLGALSEALARQGGRLHLAAGDSLRELERLGAQSGASAVYWLRCYEPALIARDTRIKAALRERGVAAHSYPGNVWLEPWQISRAPGQPYRMFSPFWRKLRAQLTPQQPLRAPHARLWMKLPGSLSLAALALAPRIPWAAGLVGNWRPGEAGARERLRRFGERALPDYAVDRDRPADPGTSRLSPHLHFGEITPRQVLYGLHKRAERLGGGTHAGLEAYLRELGWREFACHLLYHFPHTSEGSFNPRFAAFPWAEPDERTLGRWQSGCTGVPLVDAGMRELWSTGWMHNRVRMIAASFLTKNLLLHWKHGARWFWDTLVDADLASNTLNWQWVAGCGADAAPYFRVFNPFTQAARFDAEARYLKRWLPELAVLPAKLLHEPWRDPAALARCGYPSPMVEPRAARRAALEAFAALPD